MRIPGNRDTIMMNQRPGVNTPFRAIELGFRRVKRSPFLRRTNALATTSWGLIGPTHATLPQNDTG